MSSLIDTVSSLSQKFSRVENLIRYVTVENLKEAHDLQDVSYAKKIDKITKEVYGKRLDENLQNRFFWHIRGGQLRAGERCVTCILS